MRRLTLIKYKEKQHGMFTYFLLKNLQDSKGECTLGELVDNVTKNVKRHSIVINRKSQTPTFIQSSSLAKSWRQIKL